MLNWLPKGKKAAVCFTIDDIHPASQKKHGYEAGGDLNDGALGLVNWLHQRHEQLKTTLFVTADWRERTPVPTKKLVSKLPWIRDQFYLSKRWPKGTMSLLKHVYFVNYLNENDRFEVALHGLNHVHKGLKIPVEFQNQSIGEFETIIGQMIDIFDKSGINYVKGICPPGWNAPENLQTILEQKEVKFLASARDIFTDIDSEAKTNMSGLNGLPLIHPAFLKGDKIIHIPSNFQATSPIERAIDIIENGGLLSVKGHIIKNMKGIIALDGIDQLYMNYLDLLFSEIKNRYGDSIWWTTMGEITDFVIKNKR